jgi:hypothetical protein
MNKLRILPFVLIAASLVCLSVSCSVPGAKSISDSNTPVAVAIATDYSGDFTYKANVGKDDHDVYFVFSNKSVDTSAASVSIDQSSVGSIKVNGVEIGGSRAQPAGGPSMTSTKAVDVIARSNKNIQNLFRYGGLKAAARASSSVVSRPNFDSVGGSGSLYDIDANDYQATVAAHCRKVVTGVSTNQGARTLNIWVTDDCWSSDGTTEGTGAIALTASSKKHVVTQAMVDALADKFLKAGLNNDIYDWETNFLGAEWGTPTGTYASSLIAPLATPEITILLSDIAADNNDDATNGVIVGYFWEVNNFKDAYMSAQGYHSNERIMFVIDAQLFANPSSTGAAGQTSGWSTSSYWAEECFSTLSHEFQHMIEYYQKGIRARGDGESADTWINEMCSLLTEDLIAYNLGVPGPRGVAYSDPTAGAKNNTQGRIPFFNRYLSTNDRQLTKTGNYDALDYSFSYAFGSWLARNYGGAEFVRRVVQSSPTDGECITSAVKAYSGQKVSLGELVQRWSMAVLGSDRTDMPIGYRYNTGKWVDSTISGMTYRLGSINFFNYSPAPKVLDGTGLTSAVAPASNVYYLAASGMTGSDSWKLSLPEGVTFSVYITP